MSASNPQAAAEIAAVEDTSFTGFYASMRAPEKRTFWACAAGWGLDGMDFMIYPLVIGTIITMWKVDAALRRPCRHGYAFWLRHSGAGWRALSPTVIGRVRTLQITILWFSLF